MSKVIVILVTVGFFGGAVSRYTDTESSQLHTTFILLFSSTSQTILQNYFFFLFLPIRTIIQFNTKFQFYFIFSS